MTTKSKGKADEIDTEIGRRLRAARLAAGLNQSEMARMIGVTFQQVQKYERGTNRIAGSNIVRALKGLKLQPTDLLPL